jgi:protoporphyrinogen oxidase
MEIKKVKYLIVGAGVSGLSTAAFLGKDNDYLILEKSNEIGGFCKTIKKDGFTWDYSGHFFHFNDEDIKKFVLEDINSELLEVNKKTGIFYKNKYISFPFQNNIDELDKEEFIECLYDTYFKEEKKEYTDFLDWLYGNLGVSITNKFIKPYNEKLYACDLSKLDVNAMGRFFPKSNFDTILKNIKQKDFKSYNDNFIYPKGGAIEYIYSIMNRVSDNKLKLNTTIKSIDVENKIVETNEGNIEYEYLISSMPFNKLLNITNISHDESIYTSNKVLVFNIGFDKPSNHNYHWLYVPSDTKNFYRVGFYDNILGEDRMSIYVEIGLKTVEKRDIEKELYNIIDGLTEMGIVDGHNVVSFEPIIMNPAYVHITKESIEDVKNKMATLNSLGVYSIGRYGEWTYCSIEDNIISAKNLVNDIG